MLAVLKGSEFHKLSLVLEVLLFTYVLQIKIQIDLSLSTNASMHTTHVILSCILSCKRGIAVPAVKARFFISMSGLHV